MPPATIQGVFARGPGKGGKTVAGHALLPHKLTIITLISEFGGKDLPSKERLEAVLQDMDLEELSSSEAYFGRVLGLHKTDHPHAYEEGGRVLSKGELNLIRFCFTRVKALVREKTTQTA